MSTENIIFTGVAMYMIGMLGIGYYASRKTQTVTDFMVAGRGLSLPLCSMTVMATWFGGAMMLGGAGIGLTSPGQIVGKMPTRRAGETPATRGGTGLLGFSLGLEVLELS